jgi:hypothetical protein
MARTTKGGPGQAAVNATAVSRMLQEAVEQSNLMQLAMAASPIVPVDEYAGEFAVEEGWGGFDATRDAHGLVAVGHASTDYDGLEDVWGKNEYRIRRYLVGKRDIANDEIKEKRSLDGLDLERHIVNKFRKTAAALHHYRVFGPSGLSDTTNGYDSGNQVTTDVDLSDEDFDIVGAFGEVESALIDAQAWAPGDPNLHVFVAPDAWSAFITNQQLRNGTLLGAAVGGIPTMEQAQAFLQLYLPGATLHKASGRYVGTDGDKAHVFSEKVSFVVAASGNETSYLKTMTTSEDEGGWFRLRSQVNEALGGGGRTWFCDALLDQLIAAPKAAFCWDDVLGD